MDFWKAASALCAFSSAILSRSAATFSALSARAVASSAFILAASAAALAACASCNACSAFALIIFCCACTFSRSPDVAQPVNAAPKASIIEITKRRVFIFNSSFLLRLLLRLPKDFASTSITSFQFYICFTGSITMPSMSKSIFKRLVASLAALISSKGPATTR